MNSRNYSSSHTVLISKTWLKTLEINGSFIPPRTLRERFKFRPLRFFTSPRPLDFFNRLFAPSALAQVSKTKLGGI